jgi:hypothetical protein
VKPLLAVFPFVLGAGLLQTAGAQASMIPLDSVHRGAEIRVWARDPRLNGWKLLYLGRTDTSIVLTERAGSAPAPGFRNEIAWNQIDLLQLNSGRRLNASHAGASVLKGIGLGGLIGASFGLVALAGQAEEAYVAPIAFGTLGAFTGGIAGLVAGVNGGTVWTEIRIR